MTLKWAGRTSYSRRVNTPAPDPVESKSWRVPPTHPAALLVVVSALAALNIYGHPRSPVRAFTLLLAVVCLGLAFAWLRMALVADAEGIAVRHYFREVDVPWEDVQRIDIVTAPHGGRTIRVLRHNGSYIEAPPSLLQPSRPMSKPKAEALLKNAVREIEQMAPAGRRIDPGDTRPGSSRW
jgi:hypothetical protein